MCFLSPEGRGASWELGATGTGTGSWVLSESTGRWELGAAGCWVLGLDGPEPKAESSKAGQRRPARPGRGLADLDRPRGGPSS
jgi:hypothetical protein